MIFKCETKNSTDSSTNWVLFAIHAREKRVQLSFWAKLSLWLRGKL